MTNTGKYLIQLYIITIFTYGFWVNYFHFTLIIDFAMILCLAYTVIKKRGKLKYDPTHKILISFCSIFILGVILVAIVKCYTVKMSVLGARSYIAYMLMTLIFYNIDLSEKQYVSVLNTIEVLGVLSSVFGIIQFLFYSYLPEQLLHMGASEITYVYGLGNLVFRSNGLYENTIVYSGVLGAVFALILARIHGEGKKNIHIINLFIVLTAEMLTFSRAAMVGIFIIFIFEEIVNIQRGIAKRVFGVITTVLIIGVLISVFFSNTVYYKNFVGQSSNSQESNRVHAVAFKNAKEALENNWELGIGMGTQGYESTGSNITIVRDGTWYTYALELGIPLTAIYWLILGMCIYYLMKKYRKEKEESRNCQKSCMEAGLATIFFFVAISFLNSAYIARENMALSWLFIALAFHDITQTEDNIDLVC